MALYGSCFSFLFISKIHVNLGERGGGGGGGENIQLEN